MIVEIVKIERDHGPNNTTLVTIRRDGVVYEFTAGRHAGKGRIMALARTLKL